MGRVRQGPEAEADQDPVFPGEGGDIGHRPEGDEAEAVQEDLPPLVPTSGEILADLALGS